MRTFILRSVSSNRLASLLHRPRNSTYLVPGPVEDGAGQGGGFTELRGGDEAAADAYEAVRRGGARPVTEELGAGVQVPATYAGVRRRRSHHQFRLHRLGLVPVGLLIEEVWFPAKPRRANS